MSGAESLYDKIWGAMQQNDDSTKRFLPAKSLDQLITEEAVTAALESMKPLPEGIDLRELVCFVCIEARGVFATLVWSGREHLILGFYRARFTDQMLPVVQSGEGLSSYKEEFSSAAQIAFSYTRWHTREITDFYDDQWAFLSPVFQRNKFHHQLPRQYHMPFLSTTHGDAGRFGNVRKSTIHRDHLDIDIETMHDEYHHPVVAKKELKKLESWSDEVFKEAAEREAVVLKTMLQFSHEHFIKTIAYCEVGEMEKYFLFPWAEDGNLKQYWDNQTPRLDEVYLKWVFSQLTGLAGAIHQLHEEGLCRHGDIKPQNILCFKDMGTGAINCRLVIADLGLAKVHAEATALRNGATTTMSHTVMYSAPEAEFNIQPRSRLYDVWSIGCTYLEFVIWLLWRKPQLDQFQLEIGGYDHRGTFYDTDLSQKPPYRINSRVKKWIKDLQNDPRCSEDTALRRLIDLIATRLLIVRLPETKESSSPPVDTQGPLKVLARQATTLEPSSLEPIRATAEEMHNRLRSISTDIEANRCKFMDDSKSEGEPPQFRPTLTLPTRNVHAAGIGIRKLAVR